MSGRCGEGAPHRGARYWRALKNRSNRSRRFRYYSASNLVQELQTPKQGLFLSDALTKLDKYRLLIIHDIGYVKRTEAETSVLFELIAHRHGSGSLLIASNHPFSAWDSIFPDNMMAVAAVHRLVHHADIIELNGESYRKRAQTARRKEKLNQKSGLIRDTHRPAILVVTDRRK